MNAFLRTAPLQIVQAVLGFATIAAFTRLMTPEAYGVYALTLSLSLAAHTLALTWAEAAAFRFHPHAAAGGRLADHFATLRRCALLAATTAGLGVGAALAFGGTLRLALACAIGAAFFRFVLRLARETDRAALTMTRYVIAECIYLISGFALGAALLALTPLGAAAPFVGLLIAGAALAIPDAVRLLRQARGGAAAHMARYAAYGAPLALALALDLAVQALSRLLLTQQAGAAETGAYAAAFGLARPLDLLFVGFAAACAPLLQSAYEREGVQATQKIAREAVGWLLWAAAPAACGLALIAAPLAHAMIGEGLSARAAQALPWLALAGLMNGFALYYWSEAFQLARATVTRALIMLAPAALQIALTAMWAPEHGARGAAMAAGASAGLCLLLLSAFGRRLVKLPLPLADIAKIALACALMTGVVAALPALGGFAEAALKAACGVMAYAGVSLALDIGDVRARASALLQPVLLKVRLFAPEHGRANARRS